jgi:CDP-diacylglycerol---serine O-phosphatidyltransferase
MKSLLKHLPNTLTLLNLTCGVSGILFWQHDLRFAASCIFAAMIFDFFDGFVARVTGSTSQIGKQLDSLADVVSFGVLPALVLFGVLHPDFLWMTAKDVPLSSYLLIAIPLCSALRLAKFNTDEKQSSVFNGLPTPANAFWIASVPFIVFYSAESSLAYRIFSGHSTLLLMALASSALLLIPVSLMAMKFKSFQWKANNVRYVFVLSAVLLFAIFRWTGIPLIILAYIILSLFAKKSTTD